MQKDRSLGNWERDRQRGFTVLFLVRDRGGEIAEETPPGEVAKFRKFSVEI